nr:hypothetical protein CFP56_19188 [Quercus suber]
MSATDNGRLIGVSITIIRIATVQRAWRPVLSCFTHSSFLAKCGESGASCTSTADRRWRGRAEVSTADHERHGPGCVVPLRPWLCRPVKACYEASHPRVCGTKIQRCQVELNQRLFYSHSEGYTRATAPSAT